MRLLRLREGLLGCDLKDFNATSVLDGSYSTAAEEKEQCTDRHALVESVLSLLY